MSQEVGTELHFSLRMNAIEVVQTFLVTYPKLACISKQLQMLTL
jgi:hypothetical protein